MSMMLGQRIKRLEDRIAALEAQMEVVKNVSLEYVQKKSSGRPPGRPPKTVEVKAG